MTRPPEPEIVMKYWQQTSQPMPRCCHTCDHYDQVGRCDSYDMTPPAEFASTINACDRWLDLVPF